MMELARAIEILDPEHRELYYEREGGLEEVTEACRMGMEALKAQLAAEDETMTAAQQEMAIYEAAVQTYGANAQILIAVEEMAELTKALLKFIRYGNRPAVLESINEERADVEIMLNQLHVIFGDCSDWESIKLSRLADRLDEAHAPTGRYDCACPEHEERPCDNPNEDMECRDCQHGVSKDEV